MVGRLLRCGHNGCWRASGFEHHLLPSFPYSCQPSCVDVCVSHTRVCLSLCVYPARSDVLFCHRPDPDTPIEETVRTMNWVIDQGWAFYWGTSEWSAAQLEEVRAWCAGGGVAWLARACAVLSKCWLLPRPHSSAVTATICIMHMCVCVCLSYVCMWMLCYVCVFARPPLLAAPAGLVCCREAQPDWALV